jgi:hypothetical protein
MYNNSVYYSNSEKMLERYWRRYLTAVHGAPPVGAGSDIDRIWQGAVLRSTFCRFVKNVLTDQGFFTWVLGFSE